MYDVVIIGAGAAGLTAALYTGRRELKTLVISKDLGGQATLTDKIYNYPGVKFSAGIPLMDIFKEQAQEAGAEFVFTNVSRIEKEGDVFTVHTTNQDYQAKVVLLCFGLTPRNLELENEEAFFPSVFHAVMEYGPKYKDKTVAVIGGGNSAFDSIEFLQPIAKKIYLVHRRDSFRGEEVTLKKIQSYDNVEFVLNSAPGGLKGEKSVQQLIVQDVNTKEERALDVDGVCVNIGYAANTKWLEDLVNRDARGNIEITPHCETKTEGLFAAGDCTTLSYKQIVTSAGEGCKAALKAYEYLMKKEGKRAVMIDWT